MPNRRWPSGPLGGGGVTRVYPSARLSLTNYYERPDGRDNKFGYFDIGALFTVRSFSTAQRSSAREHPRGGVKYLALGDGTKQFNVKAARRRQSVIA